jgi:DNA-binding LacI/PurR family transcriptional regulator
MMASQRDIAQQAGVSQMAVSLALRDSPTLPAATRQRIQKLARELDYRPDPMLSSLMRQRHARATKVPRAKIVVLHNNSRAAGQSVSAHYATAACKGAREFATERGYIFESVYLNHRQLSGKRLSEILWTQNVQGLIIAPLPMGTLLELDWFRFAVVSLDYSITSTPMHRVIDDHMAGMARLIPRLLEKNYRRPGLVMREANDDRTNHNRLGAFLALCARTPALKPVPPLLFPKDTWDELRLAAWLRRHSPDVLVTGEPQILDALHHQGIVPPRDLGVASFYKDPRLRRLSGITVDPIQVGRVAARVLISMVESNLRGVPAVPTITHVDATDWDVGETL